MNQNCTLCGECIDVCPVERNNSFNQDADTTRAIYHPHDLAFPEKYAIDREVCIGSDCGKCADKCPYDAIRLDDQSERIEVNVGSIIIATGWEAYDAGKIDNLSYFHNQPDKFFCRQSRTSRFQIRKMV